MPGLKKGGRTAATRSARADEDRMREMWASVYLYFAHEPQLTTSEIGRRLYISRSKVSRYISEAKREGFVRIIVEPPAITVLEQELVTRFSLRDAKVVMADEDTPETHLVRLLGAAAARYVERNVHDNMAIGLAGGKSINETVRALRPGKLQNVDIYPLVGPTTFDPATSAVGLVRAMWDKYAAGDVRGHQLAEYLPRNRRDKQRIADTSPYKEALEAASNVDLALVGVGSVARGSTLVQTLQALAIEVPASSVAVGDVAYQLFDADGKHVRSRLDDVVVAVSPSRLRELHEKEGKRVVAVAGGDHKVEAIAAGLRGRFFDVLVTDERTARKLLRW